MRCELCNKELELEKENEEYIKIVVKQTPTFPVEKAICDSCLDIIVDKLSERKKE